VLGLRDAAHGESGAQGVPLVIDKLACSLVGQAHAVRILPGTRAHRAYGVERAVEQFRCSYGLNPLYRESFAGGPLQVVGTDLEGEVRIVELPAHRFFLATLFLPQLTSSVESPHPLIVAYLKTANVA
jgi:CTP synthase (UTP-ammonia lyase)